MKKKFNTYYKAPSGVFRMSKRTTIIVCAVVVAIIGALLTVGAFFDYDIDVAIAQPFLPTPTYSGPVGGTGLLGQVYTNNTFAKIIEIVGTAPCIIVTLCALAIFYHNATTIRSIGLKWTIKCSCVAVGLGWMMYACFFQFFPLFIVSLVGVQAYSEISPLDGLGNMAHSSTAFAYLAGGFVFGVLMFAPILLAFKQIRLTTLRQLLRWAFIVSSAGVISILIVEIGVKPIFQRERFRFIYATSLDQTTQTAWNNVYGGFHNWYQLPIAPNAFQKGNLPFISEDISKSCPSGHETMAAVGFLSLIFLPFTVTSLNTTKWRSILFTAAIIGTVTVGMGRMMAGAHYLSDVTLGIVIGLGTLTLFYLQTRYSAKYLNAWTGLDMRTGR